MLAKNSDENLLALKKPVEKNVWNRGFSVTKSGTFLENVCKLIALYCCIPLI